MNGTHCNFTLPAVLRGFLWGGFVCCFFLPQHSCLVFKKESEPRPEGHPKQTCRIRLRRAEVGPNYQRGLLQGRLPGPTHPRVSAGLGCRLRICPFNKLPGEAAGWRRGKTPAADPPANRSGLRCGNTELLGQRPMPLFPEKCMKA